ncbi:T9SS type A sorting domain-containing protein [Bacteroidota bacterium]
MYALISYGQPSTGDFQSFQNGAWNSVNSWSRYNGSSWINPAPNVPTSADGIITINHSINIASGFSYTVDQLIIKINQTLTIDNGGTLILLGSGSDLTFEASFGTPILNVSGVLRIDQGATIVNSSANSLIILSGGVYRHNYSSSPGQIYNADWKSGSILEIIGYTSNSGTPSGLTQTFYDVIWNCSGQSSFIDLNGGLTTVNNDLTISNTGGSFLVFTQNTNYTLSIGNNFSVSGNSAFAFNGFTDGTTSTINIANDFNYTSSTTSWFSVDGSATINISGNTTINSSQGIDMANATGDDLGSSDLNLSGNFTLTSGTINNTNGSGAAAINFVGSGNQTFTNSGTITAPIDFAVNSGSTLVLSSENAVTGSGSFSLNSGGTLSVGSTHSSGAIQNSTTTGNIRILLANCTYNSGSTIIYNGSGAQYIGNGHPSTSGVNTTINNSSNVSVNVTSATIGGNLDIVAGDLSINGKTLTVDGTTDLTGSDSDIAVGTGTLTLTGAVDLTGSTSDISVGTGTLTINGALDLTSTSSDLTVGSGTLNLNDATDLNGNDIINTSGDITIADALTFGGGSITIGTGTLAVTGSFVDANSLTGGSNSNISIGGTGALGTLNFTSGSVILNNFTIDRTSGGSVTLGDNITISGTLTQTNGNIDLDGNTLTISGAYSRSSGDLLVSSTAAIIINTAGALPASANLSGSALGTLTLDRNGVTFATGSSVTIITLNLTDGTFNNSGSISMADGGTINRAAGSMNSSPTNTSVMYNVVYNNSGDIDSGPELTSETGALNNIAKSGGGTLTLLGNKTINGTLTFSDGTFAAGSNTLTLKGNLASSSTSSLASSTIIFDGTCAISGSTTPTFGAVQVTSGNSLDLGTNNANFDGALNLDGTLDLGSGNIAFNSTIDLDGNLDLGSGNVTFNDNLVNDGVLVSGTGTVIFDGTTETSGTSSYSFNNVTVSGSLTASSNTTSVSGAWFVSGGTFDPNNGTILLNGSNQNITSGGQPFFNLEIAGTSTKTLQDALDVNNNLTLTSSTLDVSTSDYGINVGANWTNNGGVFSAQNGLVLFNGSAVQVISGTDPTGFYDIEVTNTAGPPAIRVNGTASLQGVLTLADGTEFDADGTGSGEFTLISDANGDASIMTLPAASSVSGNVTVQRYISGDGQLYRYMSSQINGTDVADWQEEFSVSGTFTGADPSTFNEPSIWEYDETATGDKDQGWSAFPVSSNTEIIETGKGYAVFIWEGESPVTAALRGPINSHNVALPVNYTDGGVGVTEDGWNLVANPYPAAINWDAVDWTKTNLDDAIYIRDNVDSVFASYIAGMGVNGGTQNIATGQCFWVKANAASPALQVTESCKNDIIPVFFKEIIPNVLRITLVREDKRDETVIYFRDEATNDFDGSYDAYKMINSKLNLSSFSSDSSDLSINSLAPTACDVSVGLKIQKTTHTPFGEYQLEFSEFESFEANVQIYLYDFKTDSIFNIVEDLVYTFEIENEDDAAALLNGERFHVYFGMSQTNLSSDISSSESVCENAVADVTIIAAQDSYNYQAFVGDVAVSDAMIGADKDLTLSVEGTNLQDGANMVIVKAQKPGCDPVPLLTSTEIEMVLISEISGFTDAVGCQGSEVELTASGAPVDGTYNWYETEDAIDPIPDQNGPSFITPALDDTTSYYVAAVNKLGCESTIREEVAANIVPIYEIGTSEGASACIENSVTLTATGAPDGGSYNWYESMDAVDPIADQHDASFVTPVLTDTTTYYVSAVNALDCESAIRVTVTAEIVPLYTITEITGAETCADSVAVVEVAGAPDNGYYNWYETIDAVDPIADEHSATITTAELTGSVTLYVTAVNSLDCESAERTPVTVDIVPIYEVASSEGESICIGSTATLAATGAPDGGSYNWYESEDGIEPIADQHEASFLTSELDTTTTYYVTAVNALGCESYERVAIVAEVVPIYEISEVAGAEACINNSVTISASGAPDNGSYNWYEAIDAVDPIADQHSSSFITPVLGESTTYYVTAVNSLGCESTERSAVTATIEGIYEITEVVDGGICRGEEVTLEAAGAPEGGSYNWYTSLTAMTPIPEQHDSTYIVSELFETTTYYVTAVNTLGCESSERIAVSANIEAIYGISSTTGGEECAGNEVTLTAAGAPVEGSYNWYESIDATDPMPDQHTSTFTTSILLETTTYYVTAVNAFGCESVERSSVTADILLADEISSVTGDQTCPGNAVTLEAEGAPLDGSYNWYTSADAVDPDPDQHTSSFLTPELSETTTYYVAAMNADGCESTVRVEVSAEVILISEISETVGNQACLGDSIVLTASGAPTDGGYNWYTSMDATDPVTDEHGATLTISELVETTTYYVTAVNALGCESERISVIADMLPVYEITNVNNGDSCYGDSVSISVSGAPDDGSYNWYTNIDSTDPLPDQSGSNLTVESLTETTTYYVTALSASGCESSVREPVTAELIYGPSATADADPVCEGNSASISAEGAPFDGYYNWYETSDASDPDSANHSDTYLTPSLEIGRSYWVTAVEKGCEGERMEVSIEVEPLYAVRASGNNSFCEDSLTEITISSDGTGVFYRWYFEETDDSPFYTGESYTFDQTATFYVSSVNSFNCENPVKTAFSVTEIILDQPDIDTVGNNLVTSSIGDEYYWYLEGDQIATTAIPEYAWTEVGNYSVSFKVGECTSVVSENFRTAKPQGLEPENFNSSFVVYPNPTDGIIIISSDEIQVKFNNIQVFDISGRMLKNFEDPDISNNFEIDLSSYEGGVIFIKAVTDKGMIVKKVIKK